MWPFTHTRRRDLALESRVIELEAQHRRLEANHAALEERYATVMAQHLSLRGRVYALWGKDKSAEPAPAASGQAAGSPTAPVSRAELRKIAGIRPGAAYQHRDTQPTKDEG